MNLKPYVKELADLYSEAGGVIAECARIFCKRNSIEYTDTFRRDVSRVLAKAGISKSPQYKSDPSEGGDQKWEESIGKDEAYMEKIASEKVQSLEDLVRICNIDLDVWTVERYLCNVWGVTAFRDNPNGTYRSNYQVKVWLKRKSVDYAKGISMVLDVIENYTPKPTLAIKSKSKLHLVGNLADLHTGAYIRDLIRTPDFDVEVLLDLLEQCANKINSYNASKVTINMLGDYFESISGLNHENTFKSLGLNMWGANVIIVANEIISTRFLSRINNLEEVNMVSGNHDRMTSSNKIDNTGEGAKILWHMLKKDYPKLPINYSNSVLTRKIDGINYILNHGDKMLSKKDISKIVFDYGDNSSFNLLLEGHLHTRKAFKTYASQGKFYEETEVVSLDELNYRKYVVPALFTGNYFSESLGFSGTAGMLLTHNNGKDRPEVIDVTL